MARLWKLRAVRNKTDRKKIGLYFLGKGISGTSLICIGNFSIVSEHETFRHTILPSSGGVTIFRIS